MDHGASAPNFTFWNFPSSSLDLDLNFLEPEPLVSSVFYDPSGYSSHHQIYRKDIENLENSSLVHCGGQEHVAEIATSLVQSESSPLGICEAGRRWSIDASSAVLKDRLMVAIEYLKGYVEDSDVLIQIWMPTKRGGQNVLTTIDQLYSLNPKCKSLASYRNVSKSFHLTAEEDSKQFAGLPGRVFLGKFPEWTPDVRFFRSDECPRKRYAKMYNISGCVALPVFDQHSGICLAVVEIVTTTQKISYHIELEIVCKALEAVDLRSSQDFFPLGLKACKEFYQIAVPEISETLQSICETYRLPLAETWALCERQLESEHQQFPKKFDYCISTVDSACYIADNDLLGFHEACSEQYLFLDQGIVGKAFAMKKQRFATDITSISKTDYPLSHHARIFNLGAAVAIPLRNMYTGLVQFVLEIFLPRDCKDIEKQKQMWNLLPVVIQQACRSFHVVIDKEIDDEVNEQPVIASDGRPDDEGIQNFASSAEESCQVESCWTPYKEDKYAFVSWECLKEEPEDEFKVVTQWDNNDLHSYQEQVYSDLKQLQQNSMLKLGVDGRQDSSVGRFCSLISNKRQNKLEKTISLQILRQYFAGSLKDAAKSIGVCPTTLKRICRQHGINRWPARKIKKVNHSLRKLQLVVNSIHGAEDLLQIDSFYKTFPELNSPIPEKDSFSSFKENDKSNKINPKPESGLFNPKATDAKSQSSSCSQNSGSSICCSTETKKLNNNECSLKTQEKSQIHKTSDKKRSGQIEPPLQKSTTGFRVKASFGEEHIRFSFLPNWRFRDLQQEIAKRFKIDDFSRIDLKYMDIDNEPVLLTCDADLEECVDLLSFYHSNTIKISLYIACQPNQGSSFTRWRLC